MDLDHDACYRAIAVRDARFDGRLFTGVKTTGIYCRPICPARTPRRAVDFDVSAGVQGEVSLLLRYRPPYDWPAMLGFLRVRAIAGVESVEGGVYRRTIGLDGLQGTVAVRPTGGDALRATVCFPKLSTLPKRRVFDLAADPDAIAVHLAKDPALEPLVAARPRDCACPAPGMDSSWLCEPS
jgi:hypothetical protein